MPTRTQDRSDTRGRDATSPAKVSGGGWKDIAKRVAAEAKDDHLSLMSAGVAFYFLIALIPAIAAVVSIYSLVADPAQVGEQLASFLEAAPEDVRNLVIDQAERAVATSDTAASFSAVVSILLALWAASAGCQHLIEAINAAYDETEKRGFVKRRGLALAMTLGAMLFLAIAIGAIAVIPAALENTALGDAARITVQILRWPMLAVVTMAGLAVLYRYAPNRDEPKWSWVSIGAVVATVVWLVASGGFSIYVSNFGSYNETYGSLGAIVIVMLWLFITALSIILGAELNSETERQTAEDTTAGHPQPLGRRSAYAADTVGGGADGEGARGAQPSRAAGRSEGRGELRGRPAPGSTERPPVKLTLGDRVGSRRGRSSSDVGPGRDDQGGWGSVAVTVAGRAVASLTKKRS